MTWWDSTRLYYPILLWWTFRWFPEFSLFTVATGNMPVHVSSYTWAGISFGHRLGNHGDMFASMRWYLSVFRTVLPAHPPATLPGVQSTDAGLRLPVGPSRVAGGFGWGYTGSGLGLPAFRFGWRLHQLPRGTGWFKGMRCLVSVWWCGMMPSGSSRAFFWLPGVGSTSFPVDSWFTFPFLSKTCSYCCHFPLRLYAFFLLLW